MNIENAPVTKEYIQDLCFKACDCEDMTELTKIVESQFDMDNLGIKDRARTSGLSKNFKRPEDLWSPKEKEIDDKMQVRLVLKSETDPQHYACSIPWKTKIPKLRNNMKQVLDRQRVTNYSGYLAKKKIDLAKVNAIFEDHRSKGYIEEVTDIDDINRDDSHFVNYFPVVDETRETTPCRLVFDAASKDKTGTSLNDQIEKGPNRINDLYHILLQFRQLKYAIQADISEMFLRIRLEKEDQKYHRFYWNEKIWQWLRALFGNRASPDMSQKVLAILANSNSEKYAMAALAILFNTYMDDTCKSLETEEECHQLIQELIPLLREADMKITKFYSNSKLALQDLPEEMLSKKVHFEDKDVIYDVSSVLGMVWNADTDEIRYVSKYKNPQEFFIAQKLTKTPTWTKRLILRLSATVYDPVGLICPFKIRATAILQELWMNKEMDWDTQVPEPIAQKWNAWLEDLFVLEKTIAYPRYLGFSKLRKAQLHVFCDASTKAFAACVYVRVTETHTRETARGEEESYDEVVAVTLVTAKGRMAPTKGESVSRLELAGCCCGVRLGNGVAVAFEMNPDEIRYWTDSTNCLYWINSPSSVIKTYVANRVGEVQNDSKPEMWRHVPTDQNPADIPTRFEDVENLQENKLWRNGPAYLMKPESEWPEKFNPPPDDAGKEEFKKEFQSLNFNIADGNNDTRRHALDPTREHVGRMYNGYKRLIRKTALYFSLVYQQTHAGAEMNQGLAVQRAVEWHVRRDQKRDKNIQEVIEILQMDHPNLGNKLASLAPFIDEHGILRSESRLAKIKHLPYNTRYPIILSSETPFTKLMVASAHWVNEHSVGIESAKSKIKESYHVFQLENLLRSIRAKCQECIRKRAKPFEQRIANLPSYRFEEPLQAFSKTGLDFAGPYEPKQGVRVARRKIYILLFTCLQTRAVHLEVTEAMDTEAFTNALTRYVSFRGVPTDILSDNWKTFQSEDKDLENWVRLLDEGDAIKSQPAGITWHFTPPHGPHHGGIYEIMVKATKRALRSLFRRPDLTMDQFRTAIAKVSALLNGRPLSRTESNGRDMILTPNHFLHGNLGGAVHVKLDNKPHKRWNVVHELVQEFWTLYIKSYLPELKQARRWKTIHPNVRVGDIVIELDPNIPQGEWKLAIVRKVYPSDDGYVRTVDIENQDNVYNRPITVLCPLELNANDD